MNAQPSGASLLSEGAQNVTNESVATTGELLDQHQQHSDSTAYVWYVIALLTIVNGFNFIDRMALSVLLPAIKADMVLSDGQLGLLMGLAFALFYAVSIIPIARWADRGNRRNIVATALATWSIMTALTGAAQNFWHLFATRVGVGAGESGCTPPSHSIICDYVPLKRRSGAFAIFVSGGVAGTMLGMACAGWLSETIGWRATFVVLGVPGVALAILIRLTLREPARGALDGVKEYDTKPSFCRTLRFLWESRTYKLIMLYSLTSGFVYYGLTQWWPSFYARSFQLSLSSIGLYLGVALGAGSGIGMLIGGVLSNKGAQRDVRLPLIISAVGMCLAIPAAAGSLLVPSAFASISLVFVMGMFSSVANGPVLAALYSVVPPSMRATAGAVAIFFSSVLAFGLGPSSVGLLSDLLEPWGTDALRYAMLVVVCLIPITVIALYVAAGSMSADRKRIRN
jgi:predicted MFS family arabinose efflux permease